MQPTASTAGNDAMEVGQSLIAELESAIQSGSNDKRVDTLRRITDLFVADADRFNDQCGISPATTTSQSLNRF